MKDCPMCGASLFPRQTTCPQCGAVERQRRGGIGWGFLTGGILLLLGGLVMDFAQLSFASVAQTAMGLGLTLYGLKFRQANWVPGQKADEQKD